MRHSELGSESFNKQYFRSRNKFGMTVNQLKLFFIYLPYIVLTHGQVRTFKSCFLDELPGDQIGLIQKIDIEEQVGEWIILL